MVDRPKIGRVRPRRTGALLALVITTSMVAAVTVACAPPPTPAPNPNNIANMTDEQADARLVTDLPKIEAAFADPRVVEQIPAEYRDSTMTWVNKLKTVDGRQEFIDQMRADAITQRGGFRG